MISFLILYVDLNVWIFTSYMAPQFLQDKTQQSIVNNTDTIKLLDIKHIFYS